MMTTEISPVSWRWRALPALLLVAGCAGQSTHQEGVTLLEQGRLEEALAYFEAATREAPGNREYRIHYFNAQTRLIGRLLADAQYARQNGRFDEAVGLYRRVLALDRNNTQAMSGLAAVVQERSLAEQLAEAQTLFAAGDLAGAGEKTDLVLREKPRHAEALALRRQIDERSQRYDPVNPALRRSFAKQVSLEFRGAELKQVLEAISRYAGLNFVLDKDMPPSLPVTVFLHQVSIEEALDVMLSTNQLRRRILNDTTLLIYPDTTAKQGDHQDLIVKNIFLANTEAKQMVTMLKTVLKARNVFADDKLNLLIVRDTPEMIRLVERMVSIQDVGEPEVMLELEVLEIQRSRLLNLGVKFPEQLVLSPLPRSGTVLTLADLQHLGPGNTGATISDTVLNLQRVVSDTNLLANPRIRTHNREKALIRIGDRVPVITTTATATGFVSENVQYIDVGLKLEVEPVIFPNDEISIKLALEVSSVTKEVVSRSGTSAYQIGGRNASTVLRLKDGETQVLGGLINAQDVTAANRFPGLGDLPVLGRIFSSQRDSNDKTELLLVITPRLVRGLAPPPQVPAEFWSGTENDPRLKSPALTLTAAELAAPAEKSVAPPTAAPAPPGPPVLHWSGPPAAKAGSRFRMTLKVASAQPVNRLPVQVVYNTDVFELLSARPGRFMAQGNAVVESGQRVEAESGSLFVTQTRAGKGGAKGSGDVLELEFRALGPAQDSPITALPGEAPGPDFAPATAGVTVTP
ncbi:general secretion pathway protein GspD [Dechloromonas sp. XY25]|uniref:General secretion pathway protein GspD n=1 Tax=Dechloromonas hankyongensis TaxID=2908002 RepID=A0ABS9K644_9RHOO|nr:secretin N-terminal domain-containing protein [Dechloromonas hankyongensis]MCG2578637.1 general secretion pathway protein GspD [Dechloromonas hankyongensis]